MTFGVSLEDQAVLDRLRQNRDKKLSSDTENCPLCKDDKIEPVIHYGDGISSKERAELTRQKDREEAKKKREQKKQEQLAVKIPIDKKPHHKGSTKPVISTDENGDIILSWQRHHIKKKGIIFIPSEIGFETGMLELQYNPKDKTLTITEAK